MTSITELAERIKIDNSILIHGQEDANKSLESIDRNFTRFFSIQERNRLDNLESKLDANRKQPARAARVGKGFAATAAAAANPFNWAKLLTPNNIFKGILTAAGVLAVKPALRGLGIGARGLQNMFDEAAKTQRGLNNFAAEDLRKKEKAKAKAAAIEEAKFKAEQKLLEKQRKQAVIDEKARVRQANLAQESFKKQAIQAAEDARIKRLEIEAKIEVAKAARTEAGIAKKQAKVNAKTLKDIQYTSKFNQEPVLKSMAASLEDVPVVRTGPSKLDIPVVPSQAFQAPTSVRKPFTATISNATPSASQSATIRLVAPSMADDLLAAGYEIVDTGVGIRFRALGPDGKFVGAERVLADVSEVKSARLKTSGNKKILSGSLKVGVGGLYVVDAVLAAAAEIRKAEEEGRNLKQAELENATAAKLITGPLALFDFVANKTADGIVSIGKFFGKDIERGETLNIAGGMSEDIKTDLNNASEYLQIGQGDANKTLVQGVIKTDKALGGIWNNLVGAFTGNNKSGGVLSGYDNMSPADFQAMAIAPNVDASSTTYNNGSIALQANTPTKDLANGGGFDIIGGP